MNKLFIALKSIKPAILILFFLALFDIIIYIPLSKIPAPIEWFSDFGGILNKLAFSYISAFIFYFLTQRLKFADDKVKYQDFTSSTKTNLIEAYTHFFHQLNLYSMTNISADKINDLDIDQKTFDTIITGLIVVNSNSSFTGLDIVLNELVHEFRLRYQTYLGKMLEFKDFHSNNEIEIVKKLDNMRLIDIGKHIDNMKDMKIMYIKSEMEKIFTIQYYLKKLKEIQNQ